MNLRACVGALWILAALLALPLRNTIHRQQGFDSCEDSGRLQLDSPPRGTLPVLLCAREIGRPPAGAATLLMGKPIDLNLAEASELRVLPGIGQGLSRRIVDVREASGPFLSLDDLRRVQGLGRARIEALDGWAVASPPAPR